MAHGVGRDAGALDGGLHGGGGKLGVGHVFQTAAEGADGGAGGADDEDVTVGFVILLEMKRGCAVAGQIGAGEQKP